MTKRLITDNIVVFLLDDLNFENKFEFVIEKKILMFIT